MKGWVPPKDRISVFNNLIADINFWLSWSTWKLTSLGNRAIGVLTWYPSLLNVVYAILLLTNQVRGVRKWSCRKHRLCRKMSQNLWFSWRQHKQMSVLRLGRSLFRSLLKRLPDLKGRFLYYLLQPSLFASSVLFCRIRHTLVKQHICDVSSVSTYNKRVSLNKLNLQFVQCLNADETLLLPFN